MPDPTDVALFVLQAIACQDRFGPVTRSAVLDGVDHFQRIGLSDAELDGALARLQADGWVVVGEGGYALPPEVADSLPRTKGGVVSAAAGPWARIRKRLATAPTKDA